ncbi:MAG: DNA cytosine methyltransferase [Pseudomonadota bacterium]
MSPSFIDLFCGCGGFTLGMQRAGFKCVAAVDMNPEAIATLRSNIPDLPHVLERNLRSLRPEELARLVGHERVDVIVGGPPCQGFSTARQVDGANHGKRLILDRRRSLYRTFLRHVEYFRPSVFVMENVLGLRSAAGGAYFTEVQREARGLGYRVHAQIEDAWELGVPQKRRRQLIIGVRSDVPGYFPSELKAASSAMSRTMLGAAIGDLPILRAGGGQMVRQYDLKRRSGHLHREGKPAENYLNNVAQVDRTARLTNHLARPHSARDLRDFARLREGENAAGAMRDRSIRFEFPYDKSKFKDRYTRQSRSAACSTIVAHLSKDGLMFIHPTQNRSLTPREAARVQSFPDWFVFPPAQTHAFRLIGNAVPPLVAEAVGQEIRSFLENREAQPGRTVFARFTLPESRDAALEKVVRFARASRRELREMTKEEFCSGWHALLFLLPGLHPDNALDHGTKMNIAEVSWLGCSDEVRLLSRRFARSGWPVALDHVGLEAWRRFDAEEIAEEQFYCVEAQMAGLSSGLSATEIRRKAVA